MTRFIPPRYITIALLLLFASRVSAHTEDMRRSAVVEAAELVSPAVVNIATEMVTRQSSPFSGMNPFFDDFFRDFFGDTPSREQTERSVGSGVLIRPDGTILTNAHVVENSDRIIVTLASGAEYEAQLVGIDTRTDLAVLRADSEKPLPHLDMGSSSDLLIGETVIAIGNPFGLSHTITTGVLSATNRTIKGADGRTYAEFIQTDASINPGNSGGPLLNIEGELIGINTAIYRRAEGIGFAIPIDKARRIVHDLITFGEVRRAWVGLQVQTVTEELARYFNLERVGGVVVGRVFEASPADRSGIKVGDILLNLGGKPLGDRGDFIDRLAGYTSGNDIEVELLSKKGRRTVRIRATEVPDGYVARLGREWLGITVEVNSKKVARNYEAATARGMMIVEVERNSAAGEAGLEPGDVLREINGEEISTMKDYREKLLAASYRANVLLLVQRGRRGYRLNLTP